MPTPAKLSQLIVIRQFLPELQQPTPRLTVEFDTRVRSFLIGLNGFDRTWLDGSSAPLWQSSVDGGDRREPDRFAVSCFLDGPDEVDRFRAWFESVKGSEQARGLLLAVGANLPADSADYCWPSDASGVMLGTRRHARQVIGADALGAAGLDGQGVNVVVVDRGLDAAQIKGRFGGGWRREASGPIPAGPDPGTTTGQDAMHGMMMVRSILDLAPRARIFDAPLIPGPRIGNVGALINAAFNLFQQILTDIVAMPTQPWILMNGWTVFDRRGEHPIGDYTDNPLNPFNLLIDAFVAAGVDVVFSAGNCGPFSPDIRCGPGDFGPGRDILGAASHPRVISVAAVRVDHEAIGLSSQGPGQPKLSDGANKPDLCAPSGFAEDHDASLGNSGTSAASAVAGGVVAALRTRWKSPVVPPDTLRVVLDDVAQPLGIRPWDPRFGHGLLDARAAVTQLAKAFA